MIDATLIGSTYTSDELVTYLYLENQYLRQLNQKNVIETSKLSRTDVYDVGTRAEYDLARRYLKITESVGTRHLVIANEYPKIGAEYGNGFVHKRVQHYKSMDAVVDVVAFGKRLPKYEYEYEGVNVLSGYVYELAALLASRKYDSISVHFLNHEMWNVLTPYLDGANLIVYIHGYESNRWIRRYFDYKDSKQLHDHIGRSMQLQSFWQHVVSHPEAPKRFVFVSRWWQDAVTEDMEVAFPREKTEVIHNYIDTELFKYVPKDPSQRFKLLWIRSADALKYGHDLAISCLNILRDSGFWDRISVTIIGDGRHFPDFADAFSGESNVSIQQRFASQTEIAHFHRDHGVFIVPTRLDSQGVSRDEAMSSGLVPVTNMVTAIPEFVDEDCAVLAPAEDALAMAAGIIRMFEDPGLFSRLSENAANRARTQCGASVTVYREAELMGVADERRAQ